MPTTRARRLTTLPMAAEPRPLVERSEPAMPAPADLLPEAGPDLALPALLADAAERLVELASTLEEHPEPAVREQTVELLRAVDVVHRAGLRRLGALLRKAGLERRALEDPEVELLFELYDLTPDGERRRVEAVLDAVRPYVESHGGQLVVVAADWGVVTIRLGGACSGCQGSTATLRHLVEGTLRSGLPDFERLEVEPSGGAHGHGAAPSAFVPLATVEASRRRLSWLRTCLVGDVPVGSVQEFDVHGLAVLIANVAGELYAYENRCPGTPLPVAGRPGDDGALVCPWHACRYDLRTGRRLDTQGAPLAVMPIAVVGSEVRIGMLEAPRP